MVFYRETEFQETPIGKIPSDWDVIKLGEVLHLRNGERPKISDGGGIPVFGANGIMGYTNEVLVDNEFTIVVGRVGASGQVHLGEGKIWVSDNAIYSENYDNTRAHPPFLFYLLRHRKLDQFASKTTHPIITQTFLNNFLIHLPPLEEQRGIVGVLGVVDSVIAKTGEVIAKTERLKKGLMQTLLTRGIGHKEYKQTPIGTIPKNWELVRINELGELQYGYTTSAVQEDTGTKFLRITDIQEDGSVNWEQVPYCRIERDEFSKYALQKGDLLFARIGATAGKTTYINHDVRGIFASYLIRLKTTKENVYPHFLFYFTQSPAYWSQALRQREGQLKKGINATMLSNFIVPLPSFEEQQKIAEILSAIDHKLKLERKEKGKLEKVKRGLMDLLLTGKIRVKVD